MTKVSSVLLSALSPLLSDMLSTIFLLLISCVFVWKVFFYIPKPILGVYSRPGRRGILKQIFIFLLLKWRKRSASKESKDDVGLGVKANHNIKELESVKDLGPSPLAIDAVLFTGGSQDGTYLVLAAARRADKVVQCILMLRLPGLGLLKHVHHPDTTMIQVLAVMFIMCDDD